MDSSYSLYLQRANNELKLAEIILALSKDVKIQSEVFKITEPETYYSAVISHAYYCIFYSAKAYLFRNGIRTYAPEEHEKTYEELKKLAEKGFLKIELLRIYEEIMIKAETLLGIFQLEKSKRGEFTYQKLPQANLEPAKESFDNAILFFKTINRILSEI
ncbi:MAG: HEPN domain-containing protein [Nanoarchaeota archaeon]